MALYTAESKERVRAAVDFADLVGQYTELRRAGINRLTGLCPFHEERTPSFGIEPTQGLYKCFGCGEGGDVFRFVETKEGLDFRGAIEFLADRYGVELELEEEDEASAARRQSRDRLLELLDRTATFYARYLWDSGEAARAREYLASRGLEEATLREFRVGYAPRRWDVVHTASLRAGFTSRECFDAGLVQRGAGGGRLFDRFRGRIMFPLADRRGRVLGFGARRMFEDDKGPKYMNSSDSEVFHKGQNLYASDIARAHATKAGTVVLAEGYTDVIALHQAGLRNTVGLMGTALTEDQVGELSRLAPVVAMALDADSAGQEAMLRAARVAEGRRLELRVVAMPAGGDPADVIADQGPAAMRGLVDAAEPFVRFRVKRELARDDLDTGEGKDAAIDALRPVFAVLPPSAVREELVKLVADRTDLAPSLVASWLAGPPRGSASGQPRAAPPSPERPQQPPRPSVPRAATGGGPARFQPGVVQAERSVLMQALAQPDAARSVLEGVDLDALFTDPVHRRAAAHILGGLTIDQADAELTPVLAGLSLPVADASRTREMLETDLLALRIANLERRMTSARAGGLPVAALADEREALQLAYKSSLAVEQSYAE